MEDYLVNLNNKNAVMNFGQGVLEDICSNLDNTCELELLYDRLDKIIETGKMSYDNYLFDVKYYREQSTMLNNDNLKLMYIASKAKFDLFISKLQYLENVKKTLYQLITKTNEIQLKK